MNQQNISSMCKRVSFVSTVGAFVLAAVGVLSWSTPSDAASKNRRGSLDGGHVEVNSGDVYLFGTTTVIEGASSQLVRTNAGVSVTLQTHSLEPGAVHTLWWVIFNDPGSCTQGSVGNCGLGDLLEDRGMPSLLWAAGNISGGDGIGAFGAHLRVGRPLGEVVRGEEQGLLDPWSAEVHVVVRNHGRPIPRLLYQQLNSFTGGCAANGGCTNEQFAVHE